MGQLDCLLAGSQMQVFLEVPKITHGILRTTLG